MPLHEAGIGENLAARPACRPLRRGGPDRDRVAEDADLALRLRDYLAGWYAVETRMDHSTLLQPMGESDFTSVFTSHFTMVNHARWDSLALTVLRFTRKTFWTYVLADLTANRTVAMPILCRLA